ncbi:hypothetical protein HN011_008875 [Eciton burchellii]|nr:hypothetical protein HN011_008875 [Eciton burchellii]
MPSAALLSVLVPWFVSACRYLSADQYRRSRIALNLAVSRDYYRIMVIQGTVTPGKCRRSVDYDYPDNPESDEFMVGRALVTLEYTISKFRSHRVPSQEEGRSARIALHKRTSALCGIRGERSET